MLWLTVAWSAWCLLHSLLAHLPVERRLAGLLGAYRGAYRLLYNLVAVLSLLPVALAYLAAEASPALSWPVWLLPLKLLGWLLAAGLIGAGARVYDTAAFLGLAQLDLAQAPSAEPHAAGANGLVTAGILRYSRHPWYLAGLLLLWCRDLTVRDLVTNLLLTAYLLAGLLLEERKLLRTFGEEYRHYQTQVPMLWGVRHKRKE